VAGVTEADPLSAASGELRWLRDVLWGGLPGVRVDLDPDPAGALERYVVIPSAARPRLLVPAEPAAAATALGSFNALRRPSVRVGRAVAAAAFRTGLAGLLARDRLTVRGDDVPGLPTRALADVVRRSDVVLSVNVGRPSPFRKPVAQVLSTDGELVGFAKVGWDAVTRRGVEREAAALESLADRDPRTLAVPRVRHVGPRGEQLLLVTDPLPADVRRSGREAPPSAVTREVAGATRSATLAGSAGWRGLRERADALAAVVSAQGLGESLSRYLDTVEQRHGATELAFGAWHGDWSPWNLGRAGGRVVAWDWEFAGTDVPLGLDLPHFAFQASFIGRRRPLGEAFGRAAALATSRLPELDVGPAAASATAAYHVAEVTLRYLDAIAIGASPNRRFAAEAPAVLASLADGR